MKVIKVTKKIKKKSETIKQLKMIDEINGKKKATKKVKKKFIRRNETKNDLILRRVAERILEKALNKSKSEIVDHPIHYNSGDIEVIEGIEDWDLGYHLGNAVKYTIRAGKKNPRKLIEDLEKANWYLTRKIELLKAKRDKRKPLRPNNMDKNFKRKK